jgi:hypothetical protein
MKDVLAKWLRYSESRRPWQAMPIAERLSRSHVWRRLPRTDRYEILRMVDQAEERRLLTHGPFHNVWARIQWLRRCLGGCVTAHTRGRQHMAALARRGLAMRGGRKGGLATKARYGASHYQRIGRLGALARWGDRDRKQAR